MQRTKSLIDLGGVKFSRHGNAVIQSPGRANSSTKKINQIGRFIFNSAIHKNITYLPERHSLDNMASFAS